MVAGEKVHLTGYCTEFSLMSSKGDSVTIS